MKEFFCKTAFLTVGAFFERPRANAVRPYERMWECESDSFRAPFPEFSAMREYISPSPLVSELPDALRADMRTGSRHASLAEPGCALCVAHPTRKPSPFGLGFIA